MDNNIGRKIDGRYEITELIGIGGMADVYKATDIMENKAVAVKILKTEFAGNEDFQRRFRNESKAIAVLSHPNIVKIFDVGFTDKLQYIVMEYIDGITLKEFMEQQDALKWKDAIHFTIQILRALQHAHDRGIVHRDIKPQNIMLFPDGTIKVMDFGIARFSREEGKTLSDKTIGSVHYISPEQARGDITDEKSDIYSVGAMLYEMLTGKKPFEADTPVAVALMHMQETAVRPREVNDSIPEGLEEIILHAMQKDASKRYQSASSMIKDMESFKNNPAIVFGYNNLLNNDEEGSTIFFKPLAKADEDGDEADAEVIDGEGEEDEHHSLVIPILTGVTVVVVILAAILICFLLLKYRNQSKEPQLTVPNFVGKTYADAENDAKGKFQLKKEEDYSSDFDEGVIFEQDPTEGKAVKKNDTITVKVSKGSKMVDVPSVVNKSYEDAKTRLESEGFKTKKSFATDDKITEGFVVRTNPEASTKAKYGSEVTIYVSQGPTSKKTPVPDVVGKTQAQAEQILNNAKLKPTPKPMNSDVEAGKVISQVTPANTTVDIGTEVVFYYSTGKVVETQVEIDVPVPSGSKGSFTLTAFDSSGNPIGTGSTSNAAAASSVKFNITGKGTQVVKVEVKSNDQPQNGSKLYAQYNVDFINSKVLSQSVVNPNAFAEVSKPPVETTPTQPDPTTPTITSDLTATQNVAVNGNIVLKVSATGNGTLKYQWYKGSEKLSGETDDTFTKTGSQAGDSGSYYVAITNTSNGKVTEPVKSKPCVVTVS